MNYQNSLAKRNNSLSWPSAFAGLDAQLDSLFATLPKLFDLSSTGSAENGARGVPARWFEKDDAYLARLDLPGVRPEDIELEWKEDGLNVSAVRKGFGSEAEDGETVYRARLAAPESVDVDRISARCANGVLSLIFPKSEKAKPRRIEVKAG